MMSVEEFRDQELVRVDVHILSEVYSAYEYSHRPAELISLPCRTGKHDHSIINNLPQGHLIVCRKCRAMLNMALTEEDDIAVKRTLIDNQHDRANLDMILLYQIQQGRSE